LVWLGCFVFALHILLNTLRDIVSNPTMSSGTVEPKQEPYQDVSHVEVEVLKEKNIYHSEVLVDAYLLTDAFRGENREHEMSLWESVKSHPMACMWAFIFCFTIVSDTRESTRETRGDSYQVMESFDMFLNGNFVALPAFQRKYGVPVAGGYAVPTRWQSALFQSGQCGAFVGVFLAGPVTNRLGYRWTTILALILMNATIFFSFFVSDPAPLSSLPPDRIHLGGLSHRPCDRTSV